MIEITRLNGEKMMLNIDLIELIEETPDTIITLTTGRKVLVKESARQIRAEIIKFRKLVYSDLKK
ncbi:Flagellar [Syntrophomonas zehnderi OL-4]|uniref:Flagellar n=1 Tax=Syntrophomonas zehnderi OL-4 TaxID=690567 RepID=A0A0E4GBW6_9FIRM|nr:flagellar FlbD family protein [Syntrophomonas zehnderi]CFX65189.1 Flagellar [Syntrophomonas zehnderi OL-4]